MGNECSCFDPHKDTEEISLSRGRRTIRLEEQMALNNEEINKLDLPCMIDPRSRSVSPLIPETEEKTVFPSKIKKLSDSQYKNIDIGFFLAKDEMASMNLSLCLDDVIYSSDDIFQLESGSIYKGEFDSNFKQHGRGLEVKSNGVKYLGYYFHGKIQGVGRLINSEGIIYQGEFVTIDNDQVTISDENAVLHGKGKEIWPSGLKYEGEYQYGKKTGTGKLISKDFWYFGEFFNDTIEGKGEMVWNDGKRYSGMWKNGLKHGTGHFIWPNGKVYEGEYFEGEKHGKGIMKWPNGKRYEGQWAFGKQHGEGIYTFYDAKKGKLRSGRSEWVEGTKVRWLSSDLSRSLIQ